MSKTHQIDFWPTLKNIYHLFFKNFFFYFKIISPWWVFLIPLTIYTTFYGTHFFYESIPSQIVNLLVYPMLFILFMNRAAFKKDLPNQWFYFSYGKKELLYLLYSLVLTLLFICAITLMIIALVFTVRQGYIFATHFSFLSSMPFTTLKDLSLFVVLIIFSALFCLPWFVRSALIFPSIACGDSFHFFKSLKAAFAVTKGQTLLLFFLFFSSVLPLMTFLIGLEGGILFLNHLIFKELKCIERADIISVILFTLIYEILVIGMISAFLGLVYANKRKEFLSYLKKSA